MSSSAPPASLAGLSALKLALLAQQVRAQAQAVLRADPIAIVGMACRVPGGAESPAAFWTLLRDGVDAVRPVPPERWDADAWYDPDLSAPGKVAVRSGGFLDRIDGFDADYFAVLPREAERMDPQQRLFMEVALDALDDAGQTRERLAGSRTGVYIASYHNDYTQLQYGDVDAIDARTLTGTLHSVLANRLSHFLDLHGPSLSIDTACSSSLVAVHLACQSLRFGESDLALAGGVSLMIGAELMVAMSKVGFLAADGRCKTFDAEANGFGRGEGCGLVVLKRLSDAVADGDRVLAVLRGSAVNQDGHSTLLAAPHGPAQEALIREALEGAQLDAARIGYVEAHGTGTALGDPIEVEAIAATLGRVDGASTCWLGSAKANLGHLEAAAGAVGLIKTVLALQHEAVPPQPHFRRLNPHISLDGTRLAVPAALTPWPRGAVPRCAAVSSFGVGGTNAHVIVEEAPRRPPAAPAATNHARVLLLSAHSEAALRALARRWVDEWPTAGASLDDLCVTAAQRRSALAHRLAVVATDRAGFAARLDGFVRDGSASGVVAGRVPSHAAARIGFVFCGQGPQWFGMGRELLGHEPVFRETLERIDALLRPLSGWSLLEELARDEATSRLDRTEVAQPALFALQVALAALWRARGVLPDAVVGHSIGEIAALHVAGVFDLPTAVRIVWHRGRLMQQATGLGRMAAVDLDEARALDLVRGQPGRLDIGAINAPRGVVLSGADEALQAALDALAREGVAQRLLPMAYAFHSAQMEPFAHALGEELAGVRGAAPALPLYSTVSGQRVTDAPIDAAYLADNVRRTVRFAAAIGAMADDGIGVFVEIGPHPVLGSAIAECLVGRQAESTSSTAATAIVASLRRGRDERETLLHAAAALHVAGVLLDWAAIQGEVGTAGNVCALPSYPWQHKRYWLRRRPARRGAEEASLHPLLGRALSTAGIPQRLFDGDSRAARHWLADHRIFGRLLLPAAAWIETFIAAATQLLPGAAPVLDGFTVHRPLLLPDDGDAAWQLVAQPQDDGSFELVLHGAPPDGLRLASATVRRAGAEALAALDTPDAKSAADAGPREPLAADDFHARFESLGVAFGPSFRVLDAIEVGTGHAQARLRLPDALQAEADRYRIHPVLLDAALQLCSAAMPSHGARPARVVLPLGIDRLQVQHVAGSAVAAQARLRDANAASNTATLCADVDMLDAAGRIVARLEGLRFAAAEALPGEAVPEPVHAVAWEALPEASGDGPRTPAWLIVADAGDTAAALAAALGAQGARCRVVDTDTLAHAEALDRLLAEAARADRGFGIVYARSLDWPAFDAPASADDERVLGGLLQLAQALARRPDDEARGPLAVLTRGAELATGDEPAERLCPLAAAAFGLVSVIAAELPALRARVIDLDPAAVDREAESHSLARELDADSAPLRLALRAGRRWQARLQRHVPADAPPQPMQLVVTQPGSFDALAWQPRTRPALRADEVRVRVVAAGLNFRDVLLTLDMYPSGDAPPLGAECAGVVVDAGSAVRGLRVGDRVFGCVDASFASEAVAPAALLARIPDGLSFESAAALPVAYLSAHFGLFALADLQPGERVLVHAGAGGVGLAAVRLALRRGAIVCATAGTSEKRAMLSALGVQAVASSRDLDFADTLPAATGGAGFDLVLNSLSGDFIPASLRLLARGGRFLELGKRDTWTPDAVAALRADVRYHRYDLGSELRAQPARFAPMVDDVLAGLADGSLAPLPVTPFPIAEAAAAMRHMAQARHVGKIVLHVGAASRFRPDATYWITGGLGGLGLATARWLIAEGARHLLLSGRHAPDADAIAAIAALRRAGATVRSAAVDAADADAMRALLDTIPPEAPLRGVIHAAGALHDGLLAQQRWPDAAAVLRGKADGAWLLHALTRDLPLDVFVLYSAAGLLLGAAGQGLYPAANARLDALALARRRAGLPALSVAWGAWDAVGMAARGGAGNAWAARGLQRIAADEGLHQLGRLMSDGQVAHAAVLPIDWARFLARRGTCSDDAFFATVASAASAAAGAATAVRASPGAERRPVAERLRSVPLAARRAALLEHLAERARHVLGLDAGTPLDPRAALKDAGLDSLMAVELRNLLNRESAQTLPATLLFDHPTLDALAEQLARVWQLGLDEAPARGGAHLDHSHAIGTMSEAEAEAALLAELQGGGVATGSPR